MYDTVKEYYGKVLAGTQDLKTSACCTPGELSGQLRVALGNVHPEVAGRYYGCGLVVPPLLEGAHVLDLGCGAGRDCYLLAQLVGPTGRVVGVDMTAEQLAVARRHADEHMQRLGYPEPNLGFVEGYIERLDELGLAPTSFDLIVSNCVINLSPDKPAVLRQAFNLLKPGGELYFSDVYADRRVPRAIAEDPELYGECLGGALYWNDFLHLARGAGFADPRLVEDRPIEPANESVRRRVGNLRFHSATYRLFRLDGLEPAGEDYGQAVVYRGGIDEQPDCFVLDKHHRFELGRIVPVCGNTYRMLNESRFGPHFDFFGNRDTHYGIVAGHGTAMPFDAEATPTGGGSYCG